MSANVPTDICFSFAGLMKRGGQTGPHKDGFGVAFYEGRGCRVFHDPMPSVDSEIAKLIKRYPIKSKQVICHIRKANRGKVSLENTHPFVRQLWGRNWCFAHNGQLKGVKQLPLKSFEPIGSTDSEHAFCWIMDQLQARFPKGPPARPATLWRALEGWFGTLAELGVFNVLLSDGQALYTHCSTKLCWITRQAPFGEAHLIDEDIKIDFQKETTPNDIVTVIATTPLTKDEDWFRIEKGEFLVFKDGLVANQ